MNTFSRREFMAGAGSVALGYPLMSRGASVAGLEESVISLAASEKVAGASACAMKNGEIVWRGAAGWSNIARQTPMTTDTIQNIASISKTITATAVMQLVEAELLELDSDISDYLPFKVRNPRQAETPITLRHLLTHQSSIIDGPAYGKSYACGDPTVSLKDWIASVLTPEGAHFDERRYFMSKMPGERRVYSNIGYGVLGLIVETVSGTPFERYCQKKIFEPLGMDNTGWRIDSIDLDSHATLYIQAGEGGNRDNAMVIDEPPQQGFDELCLYSFANFPDGLIRTSVNQLALFLAAYRSDALLKQETISRMLREETAIGTRAIQGLCWSGTETEHGTRWAHSGGDPGAATIAAFEPESDTAAIVFTTGSGDAKMGAVLDALFDHAREA